MFNTKITNSITSLCATDENGNVLKSNITVQKYEQLSSLIENLNIDILEDGKKKLSYREYCKVFESNVFKEKKCNGHICCQAMTEDGSRCTRPASKYASVDLTENHILPTVPEFVKTKIGYKKANDLKLAGFATTCCFYCYQHAAMFLAEKLTYVSNLTYYTTHVEDLIQIFFDNVKPNKVGGVLTYNFYTLGNIRSPSDILKHLVVVRNQYVGVGKGLYDWLWWGMYIIVFFYDKMKPRMLEYINGENIIEKEMIVDDIALLSACVLIETHKK